MQSTSCEMLGWMKHKLESRFQEEISITSAMQKVQEESEKASLKLNIQKIIMTSGPITSWK